ncbi:MAG TPA: 2-oxoacid:acceptor oxidoreductase family protein [Candidatus Binataceae bacterium]|nr:2-oxoacid:acceptor oxidoreductase family protein [Candidatus Binataceae bacterium]
MSDLIEIRIEGRGGQGNVMAAYLLAQAAFEAGRFSQAFPSFGPERRGAPVASFVRISDRPIRRRCQVREPLYVIIQDPSLLHVPGTARGVRNSGGILINSAKTPTELGFTSTCQHIASLAGTAMATELLGEPIPNTALIAALLTLTGMLPLSSLEAVLAHRFQGEALRRNISLVREAAERVPSGAWQERGDA